MRYRHTAPLERGIGDPSFSIDLSLRWSVIRASDKLEPTQSAMNCATTNYSLFDGPVILPSNGRGPRLQTVPIELGAVKKSEEYSQM